MTTPRRVRASGERHQRPEKDRRIDNVGRLTPGAGIETSTRMGSDQTAAEALQEAETEVGVGVLDDRKRGRYGLCSPPRWSADTAIEVGLTA